MDSKNWILHYDKYIPEQEGLREALCTLGNGYFATRGAAAESVADEVHYPGTYLAGGYNRLQTEIAGRMIENEDLVNMPNWLPLVFKIDQSDWFSLKAVEILAYKQQLNLYEGVLSREIQFKDFAGRITLLQERRFVHMKEYHLASIELTITAQNWSAPFLIRSALDGTGKNQGVARYRELNSDHLIFLESERIAPNHLFLKVQTSQSQMQVGLSSKTHVSIDDERVDLQPTPVIASGYAAEEYFLELEQGKKCRVEKCAALFTSKDYAISECGLAAKEAAEKSCDFTTLLESHSNAWKGLWNEFDLQMEINGEKRSFHPQMVLRLHLFHLLQTVSPNSSDVDAGVPARGWHGEAYRGHIFWDEIFIFPTLNLRMPKITASLLKYRFRRLENARALAQSEGYQGAMFPWQSGSDGREESQKVHLNPKSGRWIPDYSNIQRHVNIAIVYNFWRYWQVSGDMEFLYSYGAEVILEIARFLASLATYNKDLERYEIHCVMGPDEYHDAYPGQKEPGLNNNAYTNVMSVWVLSCALELLEILPDDYHREITRLLNLQDSERELWKKITKKMRVCFHDEGIISQFEGYEKLKPFPWEQYRKKYGDIHRVDRILEAEGDTANRYQVSKQADVLMLFYLFSSEEIEELFEKMGYPFDPQMIPKNIDYYLQRTSHGSTLSGMVHSWVMAREDRAASWKLFLHALESDVADIQGGTTAEGIHLGAMAGTVDILQRCYTGIVVRNGVLWFNPCLPEELKRLQFHLHYRGHSLDVDMSHEKLTVKCRHTTAESIAIGFEGKIHSLSSDEAIDLKNKFVFKS